MAGHTWNANDAVLRLDPDRRGVIDGDAKGRLSLADAFVVQACFDQEIRRQATTSA